MWEMIANVSSTAATSSGSPWASARGRASRASSSARSSSPWAQAWFARSNTSRARSAGSVADSSAASRCSSAAVASCCASQAPRRLPVQPRDRVARVRRLDRQLERRDGAGDVARADPELADALPELGGQLGLAGLPRAHLLVQTLRLGARLAPQGIPQVLVLAHRVRPPARQRIQAHQADVCLLEQRIGGDQQSHRPGRAREVAAALEQRGLLLEEREILEPQLLARADRPVLVAIVGQQAVPVQLDRLRIGIEARRCGARGRRPTGTRRRRPGDLAAGRATSSPADSIRASPVLASAKRRAWWSALRRFAAAGAGASSGQSASITCSRWSLCLGANASSFTSAAGLRCRHASSGIERPSTSTRKPPKSPIRMSGIPSVDPRQCGAWTSHTLRTELATG